MGRRISTTVYLDPEQIRDLRALAESTRVPMAALIRDAIDEYLWDRRLEVPVRGDDPHQAPLDFRDEAEAACAAPGTRRFLDP